MPEPQIAAYYFPNYHPDERNAKWHGKGWTEWELVKRAEPKFPGHQQPKVPLWGAEDESDPAVMAKKIDAAADHGLTAFIFDWYWYEDGPYLQRCLEEGFLKASNVKRLKFSLMWANHDWIDIHPAVRGRVKNVLARGTVSKECFQRATAHVIKNYFTHPSYQKVSGGLYFSIYELMRLVQGLGGMDECRAALDDFRARTRAAGLGEIHLNAVIYGVRILPGEQVVKNPKEMLAKLGFDSVTSYVWVHHQNPKGFPTSPYADFRAASSADWERFSQAHDLPYFPNVTMGWDASPRTIQSDALDNLGYPHMAVFTGNTPTEFEKALVAARDFLNRKQLQDPLLTINAWNEWTEGSYLEPDTVHGFGYLEAIKRVFKPA
jgi:hypothetical protein